ncbi:N-acetylglucosamine kinase [Oceanisphaera litoralis]|uniref:ROK family protein n=1 Tax=Oceanisphaera litoralis TaxID=225144 RepID=UPI00195DEEEE|nr:ROK family protein [Oceanisphaera litoralis]MBM7454334.1 N-acetylglucosamine kinase [Oceanisphaera litoralis]
MFYGVDVGGSKIAFAVFDEQGHECERRVHPTPQASYGAFMALLTEWVNAADIRWQTTGSIGIGFPGVLDDNGLMLAPNVPAIHGRDLKGDLQQQLKRPVYADNDANCFLLSEYRQGAADGAELALALTLGTGVGGALLHKGQLVNSRRGGSAEFGHGGINATLLERHRGLPLFPCGCGLRGCLETYVSGTGLARLYRHAGGAALSGPAIIDAWQRGEQEATDALSCYLDILAAGLGALMTQLDPDVVVLGGGLGEYAWLYRELAHRVPEYLMTGVTPVPMRPPVFGGSGGVRGAALLARCAALPFS